MSIQISRRLHRQAKFGNIVIQAVRGIDLAKQEVGGDIEHTGNANDIFVTQLVRLAANETAQRTLRHTDTSSKLSLCDFSGFHQVLYAVTDFTGEIYVFIAHVPHLFALFTVSFSHCYLRYSSSRVFPSLFFHSTHPLVLPPSTNMAAELGEVNGTETFSMYLLPLRTMSPF